MKNEVIRRMTMTGRLSGAAKLTESGGSTAVELRLSGLADGMRLITRGSDGASEAPIVRGGAVIPDTGIYAAAVAGAGVLASFGCTGQAAGERRRLMEEMSVIALERAEAPAAPEKRLPEPLSEAGKEITRAARELYGPAYAPAQSAAPEEKTAKTASAPEKRNGNGRRPGPRGGYGKKQGRALKNAVPKSKRSSGSSKKI